MLISAIRKIGQGGQIGNVRNMSCNLNVVKEATLKHTRKWKEHVLRFLEGSMTGGFKAQQGDW